MRVHRVKIGAIVSIGLLMGVACSQTDKRTDSKTSKGPVVWKSQMHELSHNVAELIPLTDHPQAFADPANKSQIQRNLNSLKKLSHQLRKTDNAPDKDPLLNVVSQELQKDLDLAAKEFEAGRPNNARYLTKNALNYCIQCHTRTGQGMQKFQLGVDPMVKELSEMDRATFYAATRQYDKALNEYDKALTSKDLAEKDPWQWMMGAKRSLAIAVRVKQNPDLSLELVSRLFDAKAVPVSFQEEAKSWRQSLVLWQKENRLKKNPLNMQRKINGAKKLIQKAQQRTDYPLGHQGLVEYLRASTWLHEVLSQPQKGRAYGKALYLAGVSSEALKDINPWEMDEAYYAACVHQVPGSQLAKKCYMRYEKLKYRSFIGEYFKDGWFPQEEQKKLDDLKALAGYTR